MFPDHLSKKTLNIVDIICKVLATIMLILVIVIPILLKLKIKNDYIEKFSTISLPIKFELL